MVASFCCALLCWVKNTIYFTILQQNFILAFKLVVVTVISKELNGMLQWVYSATDLKRTQHARMETDSMEGWLERINP